MAEFVAYLGLEAVLDDGTVIDEDNSTTLYGIVGISRGVGNLEEAGFADMSGPTPTDRRAFIALKMVDGHGILKWENDDTDVLTMQLDPGMGMVWTGPKSFDVSATAGDALVVNEGLDVDTATSGRGALFEYFVLTGPAPAPVQSPCTIAEGVDGCDYATFEYVRDGVWADWGVGIFEFNTPEPLTDFWTLVEPDGTLQILAGSDQYFPSDEDTQEGVYCMYASDSDGNPVAGLFGEFILMGGLSSDPSIQTILNVDITRLESAEYFRIENADLTSGLDLTGNTGLVEVVVLACDLGVAEVFVDGIATLTTFSTDACIATVASTITNLPAIERYAFRSSQIPSSEVDRVIIDIAATTTQPNGVILLDGQTPAAPRTSASDAAVTDLEGRSPGWTITLDT